MNDLISRQALRSEMYHEAFEKDSNEQRWDSGCWIRYKMFERVVDRLPSAQPEIKCIAKIMLTEEQVQEAFEKAKKEILAAQPERKKGKYIGTEYDGYADGNPVYYEWKCSECGCIFEDEEPTYNFCPNCGADMRGEQDG